MIRTRRPVRLFLLALSLGLPAFSSRAHGTQPAGIEFSATTPESVPAADTVTEDELYELTLAFRGLVAVTLPGGRSGACVGQLSSDFLRRRHDFYRSWFSATMEIQCEGRSPQSEEIWFQCSDRQIIRCSLSLPYGAN